MKISRLAVSGALVAALTPMLVNASSHREAPFITSMPKVDATDLYLFNSYETNRQGYVTAIANFYPFQDPFGGPNYFTLDPDALYEIHFDKDGDAVEDMSIQFQFNKEIKGFALDVGPEGETKSVPIPIINKGPIGPGVIDTQNLNRLETYTVNVVHHDMMDGEGNQSTVEAITDMRDGATEFMKPVDNIGNKSIMDYETYANRHIYEVNIPGCEAGGRIFVGQRDEGFAISVGEIFDLVNLNPLGAIDAEEDDLADKNVTSMAVEIHKDCITADNSDVVGAWMTASLPQARVLNPEPAGSMSEEGDMAPAVSGGAWTQVSRLGMPLVNEVVIGLPDKDRFNASMPADDAQFLKYVTYPTLPELLQNLFDVTAPNVFPRQDLVSVFLTGIEGVNQLPTVTPSEMLRLNTSIPAVPAGEQNPLGVLAGDNAGFPNGRRPGDDVVDASLRVAMGALLNEEQAPDGTAPYTDQVLIQASQFDEQFPYLRTPHPGSPTDYSALTTD